MKRISALLFCVVAGALLLLGCAGDGPTYADSPDGDGELESLPDGDIIDNLPDGDGDLDVAPDGDELPLLSLDATPVRLIDNGEKIALFIESEGETFACTLHTVLWFDAEDRLLQTHVGHFPIDTSKGAFTVHLDNVPPEFTRVKIDAGEVTLGGGDGRGYGWDKLGGGDGRGIVVDKLVIDRIGTQSWSGATLKMAIPAPRQMLDSADVVALMQEIGSESSLTKDGAEVGRINLGQSRARVCDIGYCLIGDDCVEAGTLDSEQACGWCDDFRSALSWSPRPEGEICREELAMCDAPESCDGIGLACPEDLPAENGVECDDGDPCTSADICDGEGLGVEHCDGEAYDCNGRGDCNDEDAVCSCDVGYAGDYCELCEDLYQDKDGDGVCLPGCDHPSTDACEEGFACSDTGGEPTCVAVSDGFVLIMAGSFMMGSPVSEVGHDWDEVQHPVTLTNDYEMMATEVTQQTMLDILDWENASHSSCGSNCPVENLSWYDTLVVANKLSELNGYQPCYVLSNISCRNGGSVASWEECYDDDATYNGIETASYALNGVSSVYACEGYRLPTEAEWEYAARAGTTTALYLGDIINVYSDPMLDDKVWYRNNTYSGSAFELQPVATMPPNPWGLYDLNGNLWEWIWDSWIEDYETLPEIDPEGPATDDGRVSIKGGTYASNAMYVRCAYRHGDYRRLQASDLGFRLVRTLSPANQ